VRTAASVALLLVAAAGLRASPGARADDAVPVWDGVSKVGEVQKSVREWFTATPERRAEIASFLDGLGTLKPADARKWAKAAADEMERHGPRFPSKSGDSFTHAGLTGPVFTSGKEKKGGALFVALHGGGAGVGDGQEALQKWSFVGGKALVVAPTTPDRRDSAWCQEDIEAWTLALVEAARRTFGLDPNRVYLAGHSMGGYGTWSIGCRHADRFAALGACAGGIFVMGAERPVRLAPGHVANLLALPIWFYNSTDDRQVRPDSSQAANRELQRWKDAGLPYDWRYDEYTDIGHGLPPKGLKPIGDWMLERKRDPDPRHVVFEPSRPSKRRLYWLEVANDVRVEGRIEGNAVTITSDGSPGAVAVHLNDRLIDPARPVTVTICGTRAFEGVVPSRLSTLLESLADTRDPAMWHDRVVRVP
jgi:pimeloyl-ACP methyl ester carboxylesterase